MRVIAFVVVVLAISGSLALSRNEETAISDLLYLFPEFSRLSPPWTSNSSQACDDPPFSGIKCSEATEKHIISLSIDQLNSEGRLPDSINGLKMLRNFSFAINSIEAPLPATLGDLPNLEFLDIRVIKPMHHDFLPDTLSFLSNLIYLNLNIPGYSNEFPDFIPNLKKLKVLMLEGDRSFSELPQSFCDLDELIELKAVNCFLSGLDICAGKLSKLERLHLRDLALMHIHFETIVRGRPNLTMIFLDRVHVEGNLILDGQIKLQVLGLHSSSISGSLPSSLWNNVQLNYIALSDTSISGTISPEIGRLTSLGTFDASSSRISGSIPKEIGFCKQLHQFLISSTLIGGSIPSEMGELSKLNEFGASNSKLSGTIPSTFNRLTSLVTFAIDFCDITGSIPEGFLGLPRLASFSATRNQLSGTLGEISPVLKHFAASSNKLSGTIPPPLLSQCTSLNLQDNAFTGTIEAALSSNLSFISVARNHLEGSLPSLSNITGPKYLHLDFSSNNFSGTIPSHYVDRRILTADFSGNNLVGGIDACFNFAIGELNLANNRFSGTVPLLNASGIRRLDISDNLLSGRVPHLPVSLRTFLASHNAFSGNLDSVITIRSPENIISDMLIDLSHNNISGSVPSATVLAQCSYLSLAYNQLSGTVGCDITVADSRLQVLDLSGNQLTGTLDALKIPTSSLSSLHVANNLLHGTLDILKFPRLTILDISNNRFEFDAASISFHPYLTLLVAQNNSIYGTLALQGMRSLYSVDLSSNNISNIDFHTTWLATQSKLSSIWVANNPLRYDSQDLDHFLASGWLRKTRTTTPSIQYQGVVCKQLTLGDRDSDHFEYNESIFSYRQCDCDEEHFGSPPTNCFSCDRLLSSSSHCSGYKLAIKANFYVFPVVTSSTNPMETEDCIPAAYRVVGTSNCMGISLEFGKEAGSSVSNSYTIVTPSSNFTSLSHLGQQCRKGSSGRMCSRCDCTPGACYYQGSGYLCQLCKRVFKPSQFVPLGSAVILLAVTAMSVIFFFVLRDKRSIKDTKWENLSRGRKFLYRIIHLTSLGQITIMVSFVQILVELTHWDAYAMKPWLQVVNGHYEGIGIRCIFPFLSNPMIDLLMILLVPFIVIGAVCGSVGIAEYFHRSIQRWQRSRANSEHSEYESDSNEMSTQLLQSENENKKVADYPATALATTASISIMRFFFFGSVLSAFKYLFSSTQKGTNAVFVQSVPWMLYSEARALRAISIPFAFVFLVGLPSLFIWVSWRMRHKISSPGVRLYLGSIFENFRPHVYWWELVNILRKVLVALVLLWLSPENSWQQLVITTFLMTLAVIIMRVRPWKIAYENLFEGIGAVLLVASMNSSRLTELRFYRSVSITLFISDALFVLACIGMIIWRTYSEETLYEKEWKMRFCPSDKPDSEPDYGPPLLNSANSSAILSGDESWMET